MDIRDFQVRKLVTTPGFPLASSTPGRPGSVTTYHIYMKIRCQEMTEAARSGQKDVHPGVHHAFPRFSNLTSHQHLTSDGDGFLNRCSQDYTLPETPFQVSRWGAAHWMTPVGSKNWDEP